MLVLLLISFLYYISSSYINTSNDGSHFALVSSIINKHSVEISGYEHYTGSVDYAVKDGKLYSDRLPGNAFLMVPFFLFGNFLQFVHLDGLSAHVPIQEVTVILLPNICGVLGVLFLFLLFLHFEFSFRRSLAMAIVFATCTLNWQEATHVFSHAPSMCFVLMAFYYLIKTPDIYHKQFFYFVFLLAYSSIIELQNCLLFLPALIYLLQTKKINLSLPAKTRKVVGFSALIIVLTFSALLLYNYTAFGELTLKSNKYNPAFPEEKFFITPLSGDFLTGLDRLFTNLCNSEFWFNLDLGVKNDIPGLFISSPVLLLSFFGFIIFFSRKPKEALLFTSIIIINILIAAFHKTVLIRHIFTITPFFFFPVVYSVQYIHEKRSKLLSGLFYALFIVLACASCYRVYYVTHSYWGRELSNPFPFTKELGVYFTFMVCISILTLLFIKVKPRFSKQKN